MLARVILAGAVMMPRQEQRSRPCIGDDGVAAPALAQGLAKLHAESEVPQEGPDPGKSLERPLAVRGRHVVRAVASDYVGVRGGSEQEVAGDRRRLAELAEAPRGFGSTLVAGKLLREPPDHRSVICAPHELPCGRDGGRVPEEWSRGLPGERVVFG